MSAVRMVAYGVLALKHKVNANDLWLSQQSEQLAAEEREEDRKRDELRKLVSDELKRYGLLITRRVVPKNKSYRTKANAHVLYGQTTGPKGLPVREVLLEGDFKECCVEAARLLDAMDAAQLPDTAAGLDQR